jgi:putative intracellular protease/amidase
MSTVHLYAIEGLADWEPALAIAQLNPNPFQKEPGRYHVALVGSSTKPVTTMGGLRLTPELTLDQLAPSGSALLILPGSDSWMSGAGTDAVEKARAFLTAGVPVAAICGATLALARAGLLDDRKHTSNAREFLAMSEYKGQGNYVDAPAVTDGNLITASGIFPVDFARHIFELLDEGDPRPLVQTVQGRPVGVHGARERRKGCRELSARGASTLTPAGRQLATVAGSLQAPRPAARASP